MSDVWKLIGSTTGAVTLGTATAAAAAAWYMMGPVKSAWPTDFSSQTVPVPGVKDAFMSRLCVDGELLERAYEHVTTGYDLFRHGAQVSNNGPCLGWREGDSPYKWITFNDVMIRAGHVGSGLVGLGLKPVNNTRIGIFSQNRNEYVITELACYTYSMVAVPLYDTLGADALTFILNQADIEVVFVDKQERLQLLLQQKASTPKLHTIVTVDGATAEHIEQAKKLGVTIIKFHTLEGMGQEKPAVMKPCQPDDVALICYTSGTTGNPKGVMMTHRNYIATASGVYAQLACMKFGPDDTYMSYLPLAHMYERVCQASLFMVGAKVGFYRGNIRLIMDDIAELKPTVFPAVPRVLNRLHDKIMAKVNASAISKVMFNMALQAKHSQIKRGIIRRDTIWDRLVFRKIQNMLGGHVRYIVSGSAPLSPKVLSFMRCVTGAVVSEGYGQTENTAVASVQLAGDKDVGHVGPPLPSCMMKLVDVPDMNYFAVDGKGEVCIKGPIVFAGYLKEPEKTKEAVDDHGWLHTGDIGQWTTNGALEIIDRKKKKVPTATLR